MLDLADTFGVEMTLDVWDGADRLPYFLTDLYDIRLADIANQFCLFAEPTGLIPTVADIIKHFRQIHETSDLPVVLKLSGITTERRKATLDARIPFITGSQVYLPFMGMYFKNELYLEPSSREKLLPSAQLLLFSYLYQENSRLYTYEMAERLGVSAMQITRAVRQLQNLRLFEVSKDGVRLVVRGRTNHRALYELAAPYLVDPVRRVIYKQRDEMSDTLPQAGMTALAALSRLSGKLPETRATHVKVEALNGDTSLIDTEKQVRLEIWKYPPALLSIRSDTADPLSVITSLREERREERVEQAIEDILTQLWR